MSHFRLIAKTKEDVLYEDNFRTFFINILCDEDDVGITCLHQCFEDHYLTLDANVNFTMVELKYPDFWI